MQCYRYILERERVDATRPPAWGKIKLVERAVHSGQWDWVVWADCDTYFMNMRPGLVAFTTIKLYGI